MNMQFTRIRALVIMAAIAAIAAVAALLSSSGFAGTAGTPTSKKFASAQLERPMRAGYVRQAHNAGVDPRTIVEVAGVGAAEHRQAAFVASDSVGQARVSFRAGKGITNFVRVDQLVSVTSPMYVAARQSGPSTEVREVGVNGVVSPEVGSVTVTRADGTVSGVQLVRAGRGGYAFFSDLSSASASFPTVFRAYDRSGRLLATQIVQVAPLCSQGNPRCLEG